MKTALVKIDVAAADLGEPVSKIFDLVDGGSPEEPGLLWTFNLAVDFHGQHRSLRFWRPELLARTQNEPGKYNRYEIAEILALILPEKRASFHAGEVDQLLQIRPRTRIDFGDELPGRLNDGRHTYSRQALESFLKRRWIGVAIIKGKGVLA
jgi:hypothetical protein